MVWFPAVGAAHQTTNHSIGSNVYPSKLVGSTRLKRPDLLQLSVSQVNPIEEMSSAVELENKIKKLKNGSFLLLWNIDLSDKFEGSKTFQCEDHQPRFTVYYKYHGDEMWNSVASCLTDVDPTFTISLQFINKG